MKRYNESLIGMQDATEGEWVRYEDVKHLVETKLPTILVSGIQFSKNEHMRGIIESISELTDVVIVKGCSPGYTEQLPTLQQAMEADLVETFAITPRDMGIYDDYVPDLTKQPQPWNEKGRSKKDRRNHR